MWGAAGVDAPHATVASAIAATADEGWQGIGYSPVGEIAAPDLGLSVTVHSWGRTLDEHRRSIDIMLPRAIAAGPRHIVCQGGLDSFNPADRATFFSDCADYEQSSGITIAQETHRMRPLFTPWATRDVLEADPSDQRWDTQRAWFEARWKMTVAEAAAASRTELVVVPEYGPAPYLPSEPHTGRPVADLWHVVHRERENLKRVLAYSAKGAADLQVHFDRGGASVANEPRGRDQVGS